MPWKIRIRLPPASTRILLLGEATSDMIDEHLALRFGWESPERDVEILLGDSIADPLGKEADALLQQSSRQQFPSAPMTFEVVTTSLRNESVHAINFAMESPRIKEIRIVPKLR